MHSFAMAIALLPNQVDLTRDTPEVLQPYGPAPSWWVSVPIGTIADGKAAKGKLALFFKQTYPEVYRRIAVGATGVIQAASVAGPPQDALRLTSEACDCLHDTVLVSATKKAVLFSHARNLDPNPAGPTALRNVEFGERFPLTNVTNDGGKHFDWDPPNWEAAVRKLVTDGVLPTDPLVLSILVVGGRGVDGKFDAYTFTTSGVTNPNF